MANDLLNHEEPQVEQPQSEHGQSEQGQDESCGATNPTFLANRRQFLFGAGAFLGMMTMPKWMLRPGMAEKVQVQVADFEPKVIAKLSELKTGDVVAFNYPWEHPSAANFLVKLGQRSGGGIGPDEDVVAFNSFCTHQGGPLVGKFQADLGVAGPCPLHWTTFDLTRYGMVVAGHATLGLPQIVLELDGDDIVATGVQGLIFGYYNNRVNPAA